MHPFRFSSTAALAALFALAATARADDSGATISSSSDTVAKSISSGTLTVTSSGTLTLGTKTVAVTVTGNSTINNSGTISNTNVTIDGGRAIRVTANTTTLTLNNYAGATISAANDDAVQLKGTNDSIVVNNYGTIIAYDTPNGDTTTDNAGQALDLNAGAAGGTTVNNYSGGLIEAYNADSVRPGAGGYVYNDGTIKSVYTATNQKNSNDGIDAQTNSGITIVNGNAISGDTANDSSNVALIEGSRHGITGGNTTGDGTFTMSITNNVGGIIQGDNGSGINIDGINGNEVVTIVNHGTITGNGVTGDGDGIDVDGVVNITNTGTIRSLNAFNDTSEGITVGGGTITNSGTIQGSVSTTDGNTAVGRGITIAGVDKDANDNPIPVQAPYAATTITNQTGGLIKGDSDSGIAFTSQLSSGFSHTVNNDAGATIQGGGTTVAAIVTGGDKVTINNAGLIDGSSSGKAITGGSGGIVVNITGATASVLGDITGAAGATNTLTIAPGSSTTFSYAGTIANFNTTTVSSGTFSLSGQLTLALNGAVAGDPAGYGQLIVSAGAALTLGEASQLNLVLGGGFAPTLGEQFTVINMVDGTATINGTFANLADGSTYTQDGISYLVSYEGGTGNDLVLTVTSSAIPEPATTAMIFAGLAGGFAFVLRRRRAAQAA